MRRNVPLLVLNLVLTKFRLLLNLVLDGIKMLIGGEGADELFGGYSRHAETLLYLNFENQHVRVSMILMTLNIK